MVVFSYLILCFFIPILKHSASSLMAYSFCHVSYQKGSVGYTATIKQIKNNLIPSWTLIDMIAAVFHKIADVNVDNVPHPRIEHPEDIVLKVTTTAIAAQTCIYMMALCHNCVVRS